VIPGWASPSPQLPARRNARERAQRDLLLPFASVPVQRLDESGRRPGQLASLAKALLASLERLFREHGAPVALHGGVVCRDNLGSEGSIKDVGLLHAVVITPNNVLIAGRRDFARHPRQ